MIRTILSSKPGFNPERFSAEDIRQAKQELQLSRNAQKLFSSYACHAKHMIGLDRSLNNRMSSAASGSH